MKIVLSNLSSQVVAMPKRTIVAKMEILEPGEISLVDINEFLETEPTKSINLINSKPLPEWINQVQTPILNELMN